VVNSLVLAANEDDKKGNDEAATATLERASRIEPRNATLYYKMALLKLKSKPSQAEDLAKKSAQLAANDNNLKKHSWLLVAKARELQKDFDGAKEARAKANKF
jgi:tetratricopeptide (TPR) repeat protein